MYDVKLSSGLQVASFTCYLAIGLDEPHEAKKGCFLIQFSSTGSRFEVILLISIGVWRRVGFMNHHWPSTPGALSGVEHVPSISLLVGQSLKGPGSYDHAS